MGQKVSPVGLRIGINKDWESRFYVKDRYMASFLNRDIIIRKFLNKKYKKAGVAKIEIEQVKGSMNIFIHTSRAGVFLGQSGKNLEILTTELRKVLKDRKAIIKINILNIKTPDISAQLVANNIANQIVDRAPFRTVQKIAISQAIKAGAKGIKTLVSGRLGGVEMARSEGYCEGSVPLTTLRSNIDFAKATAFTTYGAIGVKVWIYHDEILNVKKTPVMNADNKKGGK